MPIAGNHTPVSADPPDHAGRRGGRVPGGRRPRARRPPGTPGSAPSPARAVKCARGFTSSVVRRYGAGRTIVLLSSATAPIRANSRPTSSAPVFMVID